MNVLVNICMDIVQTRLYSFTTTLHFPSGPISFVTPASLSSAQALLLQSSWCPAHNKAGIKDTIKYIHT